MDKLPKEGDFFNGYRIIPKLDHYRKADYQRTNIRNHCIEYKNTMTSPVIFCNLVHLSLLQAVQSHSFKKSGHIEMTFEVHVRPILLNSMAQYLMLIQLIQFKDSLSGS